MTNQMKSPSDYADGTYRIAIVIGLLTAAVVFIAGFVLCILGIVGTVQFLVEAPGVKAKLLNGSPGLFFAFLGAIVLWRYKPNIARTSSSEKSSTRQIDKAIGSETVQTQARRTEVRSASSPVMEQKFDPPKFDPRRLNW